MSESYWCGCGKPWITMAAANRVSASLQDWRLCPVCDGPAAMTALMPRPLSPHDQTPPELET